MAGGMLSRRGWEDKVGRWFAMQSSSLTNAGGRKEKKKRAMEGEIKRS